MRQLMLGDEGVWAQQHIEKHIGSPGYTAASYEEWMAVGLDLPPVTHAAKGLSHPISKFLHDMT